MRPGPIVVVVALVALLVFVVLRSRHGGEEPDTGTEQTVVDEGERIVSITPSITETLFALGVGDRVVGRTTQCDYPPEATSVPSVGAGTEPDVEAILALRPTVVVGGAMQEEYAAVAALRDAGIEVVLVPDQSLWDVQTSFRQLGQRFGVRTEAELLAAAIDEAIQDIGQGATFSTLPTTVVVVGTDPIYVAGTNTYFDGIVRHAGGMNPVWGSWVPLDDEAFITRQADIVVSLMDDPSDLAWIERFGDSFPAAAEGRICGVNNDVASRPGPRIAEAIRVIGHCIQDNWSPDGVSEGSGATDGVAPPAPAGP